MNKFKILISLEEVIDIVNNNNELTDLDKSYLISDIYTKSNKIIQKFNTK